MPATRRCRRTSRRPRASRRFGRVPAVLVRIDAVEFVVGRQLESAASSLSSASLGRHVASAVTSGTSSPRRSSSLSSSSASIHSSGGSTTSSPSSLRTSSESRDSFGVQGDCRRTSRCPRRPWFPTHRADKPRKRSQSHELHRTDVADLRTSARHGACGQVARAVPNRRVRSRNSNRGRRDGQEISPMRHRPGGPE